jgi:hypothetical protein
MMQLQQKLTTLFHSVGQRIRCEHCGKTCKAFAGTAIMTKRTVNLQHAKTAGIPNGEKAQKGRGLKCCI